MGHLRYSAAASVTNTALPAHFVLQAVFTLHQKADDRFLQSIRERLIKRRNKRSDVKDRNLQSFSDR